MNVSVIIAVRNCESTIDEVLASLASQTLQAFEILLVDDGSSDATYTIALNWRDRLPQLVVFKNECNLGLAASLNLLARKAKGDLLARVDGDDPCVPARFRKQVDFLEAAPDVAVLGTGAFLVGRSGAIVGQHFRPEGDQELKRRMLTEVPFLHSSVMMRADFLQEVGWYDPARRRAEDMELWLRAARRFRFHNLQECLIYYRLPLRVTWAETWERARVAYKCCAPVFGRVRSLYASGRFVLAWLLMRTGIRNGGLQ